MMGALDWGTAGAPAPGQTVSGDRAMVAQVNGVALAAVIDGLGHGPDAALAAGEAARVLEVSPELPVDDLVARCHAQLRRTRGVVLSVASFALARHVMTWLGIGNIAGYLVRAHASAAAPDLALVPHGGTVGFALPALAPRALPVATGDTVVFATDGIRGGFRHEIVAARSPQQIADAIVAGFAKSTDDCCVLVVRYLAAGGPGGAV